jgi:hypothetical protein
MAVREYILVLTTRIYRGANAFGLIEGGARISPTILRSRRGRRGRTTLTQW